MPVDYRHRDDILHALLLSDLAHEIAEKAGADAKFAEVSRLIQTIARDPASMFERPRPFFWLNVYRCRESMTHHMSPSSAMAALNPLELLDVLALLAFDAFPRSLPVGFSLSIPRIGLADRFMPESGLAVPMALNVKSLIAVNGGLSFTADGDDGLKPLPACGQSVQIGKGRLLGFSSTELFEDPYRSEIEPADELTLGNQANMICEALRLIELADPCLRRQIENFSGVFVRIRSDDIRTHKSFTSPQLRGVIFLSPALDAIRLAEAIVHEYSHDTLNRLLGHTAITLVDDDALYYSPWRTDRRPLIALFHALYVFAQVSWLMMEIAAKLPPGHHSQFVSSRFPIFYHRLQRGIASLPRNSLNTVGRAVLDCIEAQTHRLGRETGAALSPEPEVVLNHFARYG